MSARTIACQSQRCGVASHEVGSGAHAQCISAAMVRPGAGLYGAAAPSPAGSAGSFEYAAPLERDGFADLTARSERLAEALEIAERRDDAAAALSDLGWSMEETSGADLDDALAEARTAGPGQAAARALVEAGLYLDAESVWKRMSDLGEDDLFANSYAHALFELRPEPEDEDEAEADAMPTDLDSALADGDREKITAQAKEFLQANAADIEAYAARRGGYDHDDALDSAAYDFALTRNGAGVGFWDRDMGALGERLSEASRAYGESELMTGDDGQLFVA